MRTSLRQAGVRTHAARLLSLPQVGGQAGISPPGLHLPGASEKDKGMTASSKGEQAALGFGRKSWHFLVILGKSYPFLLHSSVSQPDAWAMEFPRCQLLFSALMALKVGFLGQHHQYPWELAHEEI